ncbi:unnamed protein product [Amoebophrya sp. A25]|nr:unnamed protein product [Amoebophrya sp. A25]|eukprot:GSA25T00020067001.1
MLRASFRRLSSLRHVVAGKGTATRGRKTVFWQLPTGQSVSHSLTISTARGKNSTRVLLRRFASGGSEQIGGSSSSSASSRSASLGKRIFGGVLVGTSTVAFALAGGVVFYEVYARSRENEVDEVAEVLKPIVRTTPVRGRPNPADPSQHDHGGTKEAAGGADASPSAKDSTPGRDDPGSQRKKTEGVDSTSVVSTANAEVAGAGWNDEEHAGGFHNPTEAHVGWFQLLFRVLKLSEIFVPVLVLWFPYWYFAPCQVQYIEDPAQVRKFRYDENAGTAEIVAAPGEAATETSIALE